MSTLNDIVQVTISRETTAVAQASFGTPAIIAEFATNKTTTTFDRYRDYASVTEMSEDGWTTGDPVYDAATIIFSQNPTVDKIMVGRKDSGDTTWAEALNTIQAATSDWYAFMIIASAAASVTFDIDFVTSNSIAINLNGTSVGPVLFSSNQQTTMGAIKTAIEAAVAGSTVTIGTTPYRTMTVELFGDEGVTALSIVTTLGTSQPVASITYVNEDDFKAVAAWTETQKKIFFYSSSAAAIYNAGSTTDIAYFMKNTGYDRTVSNYHIASQGDATPAHMEAGWMGESLPYDPGSQTWAFKTIAGVAAYELTSSKRTAILAKNCNIYTTTAGVNITEQGKVASGEYIDIIRGIDWLESRLQEEIFSNLINVRKIPFTDEGITIIAGIVEGVLREAARKGVLVDASIVVTVPAVADISALDKAARTLPDVDFTATLQGAIQKIEIAGTVTL